MPKDGAGAISFIRSHKHRGGKKIADCMIQSAVGFWCDRSAGGGGGEPRIPHHALNVDVEGVRGHTQWYTGSGVQPGSAASAWCAVACSASPVRSPHLCGGVRKPFSGGSCKLTTRRALPASLQALVGASASAIGMEMLALPMNLSRARLNCMFAVRRRGLQQCLQTVPKDATAATTAESSNGTSAGPLLDARQEILKGPAPRPA